MQEIKKPRVVVDYVEAGMGHIVTAQAISDALHRDYGDKLEIIDNYSLRDSKNPILPKYEKFLVGQVKLYSVCPAYNKLQMLSMHIGGTKNSLRIVHSGIYRREINALIEQFRELDADMMVFTHYFTLYAAIEYRNKYKPSCKVVLYCPDNNVHGWWDNRVDKLYTNNPLATRDAIKNRFPKDRILEVFYPTRKAVTEANGTREEYRALFGIPEDKFAVVVADGVYAKAKTRAIAYELMKSELPLTVCVIAGKNEELLKELEGIKDKTPENITLIPLGFVKEAPKLYAACDVFITKAGPNAILDSVMMGTPVIVSSYASDIEKITKNLFVETKGCGYYEKDVKRVRELTEHLMKNPEELAAKAENLKFFDKTRNGADEIAADIAKTLETDRCEHTKMRVYHEFNWTMLVHFMTNWTFEEGNKISEKNHFEVWKNPASPKMRFNYKVYREYLEDMKRCGVNTLIIDVGDALRYRSHPEIAVEDAFTYEEMERELDYMAEMGFELIPKLNFSTAHDVWMKEYSRMVSTKKYYEVVRDLIDEVIELFKPKYLHIGMDEETAEGQNGYDYVVVRRNDLWWKDLYYYVDCIEAHGVRAMMWSDYARTKPEEFVEKCPKSVVQNVWYYFTEYGDDIEERFKIKLMPIDAFEKAGFDQMPTGSVCYHDDCLEKLVEHCTERISKEHLLGFMQTTWEPLMSKWQDTLDRGNRSVLASREVYFALKKG